MQRFFTIGLLFISAMLGPVSARAHEGDHDDGPPFGGGEDNYSFFLRMSDKAFHVGDYERAIACHRAIVALEPDAVDSYGVAAWLLWSLDKADEATVFIERGVAANPDDWEMMDEAAQHFDVRKQYQRAATLYKRALELMPKEEPNQMLRRRFAHASEKSGDLETSLSVWRNLAKEFPAEPVVKNNLARVEQLHSGAKK